MQKNKRILIISEAHLIKTFIQGTVERLKKETGAYFDCFIVTKIDVETYNSLKEVFGVVYANEYPKEYLEKVPKARTIQAIYGLRKLAKSLENYDIIHIQFHHYYYSYFTPIIRSKTKKFLLTFFGSDFNGIGDFRHRHNQKTVNLVDGIFTTNLTLLDKVLSRYKVSKTEKTTGILIPLIDNFVSFEKFLANYDSFYSKELLGLRKKVIACGYNAAPIVRHEKIIDALNKIENQLQDYQVIFPMTYGSGGAKIRMIVKDRLNESSLDYLVIEDFLTTEKLQALRLATDIFIHIQERDQMASSMLEHLAAGSVVITGKWLPYGSLIEKGLYFISMETPEELPQVLSRVIDNLEVYKNKCGVNREIILDMMSWNSIKKNWYQYYELEQKF